MSTREPFGSRMVVDQLAASGDALFRWRSYMPLTLLPLFVLSVMSSPAPTPFGWELGCFAIALAGWTLRAFVIGTAPAGTSARGTRAPSAATLSTNGAYSIVRHPLYLANTVIALGCALLSATWFLPVIVLLLSFVYHERIAAREEAFLLERFGDDFRSWAARVPAMIPRVSRFRPAAGAFQFGKAAVQESQGLFAIGTAFLVLDTLEDSLTAGAFQIDGRWLRVFAITAVPFTIAFILKKSGAGRTVWEI
jgi:protein-S-isoprenylcysteine O-methyltransferase Ste14